MELVTLTIDNQEVQVEKGQTILDAAKKLGIRIPTLCHLKGINEIGACRVCVVEVEKNAHPKCFLCHPGIRGNGCSHQYTPGTAGTKT